MFCAGIDEVVDWPDRSEVLGLFDAFHRVEFHPTQSGGFVLLAVRSVKAVTSQPVLVAD